MVSASKETRTSCYTFHFEKLLVKTIFTRDFCLITFNLIKSPYVHHMVDSTEVNMRMNMEKLIT